MKNISKLLSLSVGGYLVSLLGAPSLHAGEKMGETLAISELRVKIAKSLPCEDLRNFERVSHEFYDAAAYARRGRAASIPASRLRSDNVNKLLRYGSINLNVDAVSPTIFAHIKDLITLEELDFSKVGIKDQDLIYLQDLTNLKSLSLSKKRGKEDGITDLGISNLKKLTKLQKLDFSYNKQITDKCFQALQGFSGLILINLTETSITWDGLLNFPAFDRSKKPVQRSKTGSYQAYPRVIHLLP